MSYLLWIYQQKAYQKFYQSQELQHQYQSESHQSSKLHTAVKYKYKDFNDFKTIILKLKLGNCWNVIVNEEDILITYTEEENVTPKYDIYVDF